MWYLWHPWVFDWSTCEIQQFCSCKKKIDSKTFLFLTWRIIPVSKWLGSGFICIVSAGKLGALEKCMPTHMALVWLPECSARKRELPKMDAFLAKAVEPSEVSDVCTQLEKAKNERIVKAEKDGADTSFQFSTIFSSVCQATLDQGQNERKSELAVSRREYRDAACLVQHVGPCKHVPLSYPAGPSQGDGAGESADPGTARRGVRNLWLKAATLVQTSQKRERWSVRELFLVQRSILPRWSRIRPWRRIGVQSWRLLWSAATTGWRELLVAPVTCFPWRAPLLLRKLNCWVLPVAQHQLSSSETVLFGLPKLDRVTNCWCQKRYHPKLKLRNVPWKGTLSKRKIIFLLSFFRWYVGCRGSLVSMVTSFTCCFIPSDGTWH